MTIKQNGGVFGRHPTFSSADVDGNLTVSGNTSAAKTLLVGTTNDPLLTLRANNDSGNPGLSNTLRFEDVDTATQPGQQTGRIEFYMADTYGAGAGVNSYINVDSDQFGRPTFTVGTGETGAVSDRLSINYLGNVTVSTGNLVIGTSGQGIDFSATSGTGTSELFSDYEEGTFSPVFADAISGGNLASTSNTYAQYTKVGNVVHCTISMLNINTTGLTAGNTAYIQGLPFATVSAGTSRFFPIYVRADSITSTVGIQGWILANAVTYIGLENVTTTGKANLLVSAISSGVSDLAVSFSYFTS